MKNILIIGVNSVIGTELFKLLSLAKDNTVYTTSRSSFDINEERHQMISSNEEDINTDLLPDEIHELYFLPGSINLKPFKMLKESDFRNDFEINVMGLVKVLHKVIKSLIVGNGSVLTFSSVAANIGLDFHSSIATSKSALEGFVKSMAAEYATKVRFNSLAISLTNTKLAGKLLNSDTKIELAKSRNPLKMIGDPIKIAKFASVINSTDCDWISGEVIHFDGGMSSLRTFN
jgi:3-oxoacyl-[acyl-carrier protein] reductase